MSELTLQEFVTRSLAEDVGDGDHSSLACINEDAVGRAVLLVKERGVLAGARVAGSIFHMVAPGVKFEQFIDDGAEIYPGDIVFKVEAKAREILKAERLALNVMQRMSGIATTARQYAEQLEGFNTKVLDTRKTTPGMRFLEKEAVRLGGCENHRMGLFDMVMLKDNHIYYAGGIENAIIAANNYLERIGRDLKIEIEVTNLEELREVMRVGKVHRVMLDNMDIPTTREAVRVINGRFETEASGSITLGNLRDYASTGVNFISVGALTHHVRSLDLSLKAID